MIRLVVTLDEGLAQELVNMLSVEAENATSILHDDFGLDGDLVAAAYGVDNDAVAGWLSEVGETGGERWIDALAHVRRIVVANRIVADLQNFGVN